MPETTPRTDYSPFYIPAATVIAGVIIGISLIIAFQGRSPSTGTQPTIKVDIKDVKITDADPQIGDKNAKATLVYWSDYQCPFCKAVEVGHDDIPTPPSIPTLINDYVNTGKLRIVLKDYAFLSEDSDTAALYGRAVWNLYPTKYYAWREAMYEAQDEEHGGFGNEASIVALTKKISGIDGNALKADVAKNTAAYKALIDEDRAEGTKFGITGTPGFITGKVIIPGAVGVQQFKEAIDPQL